MDYEWFCRRCREILDELGYAGVVTFYRSGDGRVFYAAIGSSMHARVKLCGNSVRPSVRLVVGNRFFGEF